MSKFKAFILPLSLGIGILLFMLLFMTQISIDFRIVLLLGTGICFSSAFLGSKRRPQLAPLVMASLVSLPLCLIFSLVIYSEIPTLMSFSMFFFLGAYLGSLVSIGKNTYWSISGISAILTLLFAFSVTPQLLDAQLSTQKDEIVKPYTILDMEGKEIKSTDLKDKVVVLDFFGTWCKPCIQELKQLDKVYHYFQEREDVVFYVINTAEVGDTKEKMNAFIQRTNYSFKYAFDTEQDLVEQFDLHGVPYLLIFDRNGKLRYQHIGYNAGETHFLDKIKGVIEGLLEE